MSLANFFEKNALAASSILKGFNFDEFKRMLESAVVAVQFDDEAVANNEGRITLRLILNLFARLYPRVNLLPLGKSALTFCDELTVLARAINPAISLESDARSPAVCIVIGKTIAKLECP